MLKRVVIIFICCLAAGMDAMAQPPPPPPPGGVSAPFDTQHLVLLGACVLFALYKLTRKSKIVKQYSA